MNIKSINYVANSNIEKINDYVEFSDKPSTSSPTPINADIISTNIGTISDIARKYDVENISPRDMAAMSQNLYDSGMISFQNHALLSFQPELNPDFDSTIGKMTNKIGQPDTPRNFVEEWKDRLEQEIKDGYPEHMIKNTKEVVSILDNFNTLRNSLLG